MSPPRTRRRDAAWLGGGRRHGSRADAPNKLNQPCLHRAARPVFSFSLFLGVGGCRLKSDDDFDIHQSGALLALARGVFGQVQVIGCYSKGFLQCEARDEGDQRVRLVDSILWVALRRVDSTL